MLSLSRATNHRIKTNQNLLVRSSQLRNKRINMLKRSIICSWIVKSSSSKHRESDKSVNRSCSLAHWLPNSALTWAIGKRNTSWLCWGRWRKECRKRLRDWERSWTSTNKLWTRKWRRSTWSIRRDGSEGRPSSCKCTPRWWLGSNRGLISMSYRLLKG